MVVIVMVILHGDNGGDCNGDSDGDNYVQYTLYFFVIAHNLYTSPQYPSQHIGLQGHPYVPRILL